MKFHTIIIVYNPNSTGDSELNAKECKRALKKAKITASIKVIATKFKAHGEEIAAKYADDAGVLIVSSSGDGGYNEVINGVLQNGGKAATAVLPSGNANDHHSAVASGKLYQHIVAGKRTSIEVIEVRSVIDAKPWHRYAHSYVGFGLTPSIGKVLTEQRPNIVTEKWYVLRHALLSKSISLMIKGKRKRYISLICSTIPQMSKIIKLDQASTVHDGKMEVYETPSVSLLGIGTQLLHVATKGMRRNKRTQTFTLQTIKRTLIQLDGEVFELDKKSDVTIHCRKDLLQTVL